MKQPVNSIDVIKPFAKALDEYSVSDVQVIGGINTVALENPNTVFDITNKLIIAPPELFLSTRRKDFLHSKRDLDVLVKSSDSDRIEAIRQCVVDTVDGQLVPSVFGYKSEEVLRRQMEQSLLGFTALKTVLSDRYEHDGGLDRAIYPLKVSIDLNSLETWRLVTGEDVLPVPNPAAQLVYYMVRSMTLLRPKDAEKVQDIASNVLSKAPGLRDWVVDGPCASQIELWKLLRSLTPNKNHADIFGVGGKVLSMDELAEDDSFMMKELSHEDRLRVLGVAAFKARTLSALESNPIVVGAFQYAIEPICNTIIQNN